MLAVAVKFLDLSWPIHQKRVHRVRSLSSIQAQFRILGPNNYRHILEWCPGHAVASLKNP